MYIINIIFPFHVISINLIRNTYFILLLFSLRKSFFSSTAATSSQPPNPILSHPYYSAVVPISSTISLFLSVSGPLRTHPLQPVVITESRLVNCSSDWVPGARLITQFARTHTYNPTGYARFTRSPTKASYASNSKGITIRQRTAELAASLEKAGVNPPWVMVRWAQFWRRN
jgi:hypothetical protein